MIVKLMNHNESDERILWIILVLSLRLSLFSLLCKIMIKIMKIESGYLLKFMCSC
jgi:hypothetical protein